MLAGAAAVLAVSRFLPSRRIDGQAVFITGGSRGLGLALALEYARRGAVVPGQSLLPRPGGIEKEAARGIQSTSGVTEPPLSALGKKAERDYNQQ